MSFITITDAHNKEHEDLMKSGNIKYKFVIQMFKYRNIITETNLLATLYLHTDPKFGLLRKLFKNNNHKVINKEFSWKAPSEEELNIGKIIGIDIEAEYWDDIYNHITEGLDISRIADINITTV